MHRADFLGAVTYLSAQVTEIFPNAQLESKKTYKRRISELDTGSRGRGRGRGRGCFQQGGRGGRGGRNSGSVRGGQDDPAEQFNTFNGVDIHDITRDISTADWEALGNDGRAYVGRVLNRNRGQGAGRGGGCGKAGHQVAEVGRDPAEEDAGRGDGPRCGCRNCACFAGGGY